MAVKYGNTLLLQEQYLKKRLISGNRNKKSHFIAIGIK